MEFTRQDISGFYRLGLNRGLLGPEAPVAWADAEILRLENPDEPLIDLALSAGQSIYRVEAAVRHITDGPYYTAAALQLFGSLLWQRVNDASITTAEAANLLYATTKISADAAAVFGQDVYCIDEFFEPWMMGPELADARVRQLLARFADITLPPI